MKSPRFIGPALLVLIAALVLPNAAQATSATWNGTTNALWSTTGNWSTSPVPGVGDTATFNNAGNGNTTLTVGTISLNQVLFNTSSAAAYTLGSGTITFADGTTTAVLMNSTVTANETISANLTLGTAVVSNSTIQNDSTTGLITVSGNIAGGTGGTAAAKTVTVTGSGNTTIGGVISNGGATTVGIAKTGSGTLFLTNTANTFTGIMTISGGTVRASDSTIYGAGDQSITTTVLGQAASNGISFAANATVKALDLRYNGQNDSTAQKLQLLNSKGGNLLVNASSTNTTINVDRESGTGTNKTISFFNAAIANGAVLAVTGGNGYSLGLGTLAAGTGGGAGNLTIAPTTANVTVGNVNNAGATGFAHTLILDGTSSGNTITGIIANSATGGGVLSLTKQNSSTWTLSGVNTYTGATSINVGTLALSGSGAINANSAITVAAGATFDTSAQAAYTFSTATTTTIGVNATTAGQIKAAAVTFSSAALAFDFGATTTLLASYNALVISGLETGHFTGGVTATGSSISGTFLNGGSGNWTLTSGGYNLSFSESLGTLTAAAIPEPSTWALLVGTTALVGTLLVRRSRRSIRPAL